jgi:PAS domain S-box-containing protein
MGETKALGAGPGLQEAEHTVHGSEARFRTLAEESPAILWARDARGDLVFVNRAFRDFYGVTPAEVEGTTWRPPVHPEDTSGFEEAALTALRERKPFKVETRVRRADGEWRWISAQGQPRYGEAGEYLGHVGMSLDITDRKRAEEALRRSEQKVRVSVANAAIGFALATPQGRILEANPAFCAITGHGVEELRDLEPWRLVHPDDLAENRRQVERMLAGELSDFVIENRYRRKDGEVVWVRKSTSVVRDAAGEPEWAIVLVEDISERKRAELALREREELLRLFVEHAPAAVAMFDREMRYLVASRRFLSDFKKSLQEVLGRSHYEVFPEVPERWKEVHRRCLAGAVETCDEEPFPRADGTIDWVRWEIHPWHTAAGEIGGIILFSELITEQKRSMEALRASEAALREADLQKNRFLATLSHELRNPLAPIRNSLFILDHATPGGEQAMRAQAIIRRQIGHMTWLIDDLLDVTRIAHGKIQLKRERLDLNELVRRTVEDHQADFAINDVRLEMLPAPEKVWVDGDRVRLAQVISNLLQNAAKFTPHGGRATVSVQADSARGEAIVTVRDTGAGIQPETLPRLFQAFAQADATLDRSKGGLGLGLALVKGLIELHGGSVSVASDGPGMGATFTIVLPLEVSALRDIPEQRGLGVTAAHQRVLVIEDNLDAANTLRDVLELDEHVVELAFNGREGLEKAHAFHPDVVLCDIGLPEMDGYQVARTIRADPELSRIGLVAVTGYAQPEDLAAAKEAGFELHLAKPPSIEALERALAEVGRQRLQSG